MLVFVGSSVYIKKWLQFLHPKQHSVTGPVLEVLDEIEDGCVGEGDEEKEQSSYEEWKVFPQ